MSGKPLRVLLVEDSENDALLLLRELKKGGYEPDYERVETPEAMEEALGEGFWEVVLSDYHMPRFGALAALEVLRGSGYDTPFVVVSGKIGEDAVVELMQAGAQDYVTKEDMARLCPAIERELREVEERRRAEEALRFLSEASTELSSSLDYRSTLAGVARLTVPQLADWCAVDVLEEDGGVHRLAVEHQNPEKVAWAHELQERYPPDEDAPRGLSEVLRSGRSELYPEIPAQMLAAAARDPEHLRIMRELGFTSAMIVPLVARGRTLGAITLVSAESGRRYGRADLRFAEELASRAALAVDNARLYEAAQREISERKRAETRYRTLVEQIPAVTYIQEPLESATPKAVTYMSPQYETMFGYPAEVVDEEHWLRTLHPGDRERVLAEEARTDETGKPFEVEYRKFARDGSVVWVRDEAVLVRDEEGGPLYWLGIQYDITERKRFEEALKESEERFRATFEQAAVGVGQAASDGRWLRVNDKLCEIAGYEREELLGKTFQE
ncbi:MAG TPA: PAS domain S-box protein, partial [Rubrobacteraceae bacterium]|nr:PAS domain S-box protein [Rubrobacteraceae bacterium]